MRADPEAPLAHMSLATTLLAAGRMEEGWQAYEWRWATKHMAVDVRHAQSAVWEGEPLNGRTLLIHSEQGQGDTIQFCRYAALAAETAGGRVVVEIQGSLVRLLSSLTGVEAVIARGAPLPAFDVHSPMMSLPRVLADPLNVAHGAPYLRADADAIARWRTRLAPLDGLKVGLVWAGGIPNQWGKAAVPDRRRSLRLAALAPLGEVTGVSFISLQKGEPATQASNPPEGMMLQDDTADLEDFADTAALMEALDLVISVDTAAAHLAGALGKPVWLLNRYDTDWRWMLDGDDSPWYPSLRQFRQPSPGDWESVIDAVRDALSRVANGDLDQLRPQTPRTVWGP